MKKEEKKITKINTRIIITVFLLLVVILSGTFAWFTFSSKKASLSLTIGNIYNTQITLYPYEFSGTLNPVSSYEDESVPYTQITAINNNYSSGSSFELTYNAESIDEELRSIYVKYTITKSKTKDSGYVLYSEGNLANIEPGEPLVLLEDENIDPSATVYYRVYLWIDNSTGDHSSLQGKTLSLRLNSQISKVDITGTPDLHYTVVNLSNNNSNKLDSSKIYDLTNYSCQKGTTLSFDKTTRRITAEGIDDCTLNFTESTEDILYNVVNIGDYISYTGSNGCAGNQCIGWNASQTNTDIYDNYGYCADNPNKKFYTYGWRVLYKYDNSVYIVSAGVPECITGTLNSHEMTKNSLNDAVQKYCNSDYISGGNCNNDTTLIHAFNEDDFYNFTGQYYGSNNAKNLYNYKDDSLNCYGEYSKQYCGYNTDIIDNGGYYWFIGTIGSTQTIYWDASTRNIDATKEAVGYGVRPVIKLDSNIKVKGGLGSINNPYQISTRTGL